MNQREKENVKLLCNTMTAFSIAGYSMIPKRPDDILITTGILTTYNWRKTTTSIHGIKYKGVEYQGSLDEFENLAQQVDQDVFVTFQDFMSAVHQEIQRVFDFSQV